MAKTNILSLRFPTGGLSKSTGYQSEAPYTTPDCLNVRPIETLEERERGGSRPGLSKAFYEQLGSGNAIRMLTGVTVVVQNGLTFLQDDFEGDTLGSAWSTASWIGTPVAILPLNFAGLSYNTPGGSVYKTISNLDSSQPYSIELLLVPHNGSFQGKYQIFGMMAAGSPDATANGIIAELIMTSGGTYSGTLKSYAAGVLTTYTLTGGTIAAGAQPGWMKVLINGTTVQVFWQGVQLISQVVTASSANVRTGFGMNCTVSGEVCLAETFRVQYSPNDKSQIRRRYLVASSNGSVYKDTNYGSLSLISTTATLNTDRPLIGVERAQKLYIADNGNPKVLGTDGVIAANGVDLTAASVADWTALGLNVNDYCVVISSALGAVVANTVAISALAVGKLTVATNLGGAGTCSYRVERSVKVFDPVANTMVSQYHATGKGQIPVGCPVACLYRDRLVLAGQPIAPHVWYMSRQGDVTDWDYSQPDTDGGRAVAGTSSKAGTVGEPILALIAVTDDFMLMGCEGSLWIMRGDPAYGGQLDNVSRTVGIVGPKAWCRGPGGEIIWMSRDGLYQMSPSPYGGLTPPTPISRDKLPLEMRDLDNTMYQVQLAYDQRDLGVHIWLTPLDAKTMTHYWMDWFTKTYWPMQAPSTMEPTAIYEWLSSSAQDSCVLIGGRDGYVRRFRDAQEHDDGTTISNYVFYGPVLLGGGDYMRGRLLELIGVLDKNCGSATWGVYVGETHQAAVASSAQATGTWTQGINYKVRPRSRGASFFLKISGLNNRQWAVERITAAIDRAGKQRLL